MSRQGPRPHTWCSGPDLETHLKYRAWVQARNQALWRGETWCIPFEEYCAMWKEHWHQRGRTVDDYCMTRLDDQGPWDNTNAVIMQRYDYFKITGRNRSNKRWNKKAAT